MISAERKKDSNGEETVVLTHYESTSNKVKHVFTFQKCRNGSGHECTGYELK